MVICLHLVIMDMILINRGLEKWGQNTPFYVGVCTYCDEGYKGWFYFLKGEVYSCRLYDRPIPEGNVKSNYDLILKYRESF